MLLAFLFPNSLAAADIVAGTEAEPVVAVAAGTAVGSISRGRIGNIFITRNFHEITRLESVFH